jgi:predicted small lipoprotein YifL
MKPFKVTQVALWSALALAACSNNGPDERPPQLSGLQDKSIPQDTVLGPLMFQVKDRNSAPDQITVTAQSSDPGLIPNESIVLGGAGADRTLQLMPQEEATGMSTITLTAVDPSGRQSTGTFRVQVNAVLVSFSGRTNEVYAKDESEQPQPLSGFTFTFDADEDPAAFDTLLAE